MSFLKMHTKKKL